MDMLVFLARLAMGLSLPQPPPTRGQLAWRVVGDLLMVIVLFGFGLYKAGRDLDQTAMVQSTWPQMYCEVKVLGRAPNPDWFRISYTYNYEGRDYISTRYSSRNSNMPRAEVENLPSIAYVNPQNPSESVLSVKPPPAFGINRMMLISVIFVVSLIWDGYRLIRGY
jgi:hypothetical protein